MSPATDHAHDTTGAPRIHRDSAVGEAARAIGRRRCRSRGTSNEPEGHPMKYLTVVECPVVFPAENAHGLSSKDMLPRAGVTGGLESRHVRVLENRITAVCIWTNESFAKRFFDADWHAKADAIWGAEYQTRFETIDSASAA